MLASCIPVIPAGSTQPLVQTAVVRKSRKDSEAGIDQRIEQPERGKEVVYLFEPDMRFTVAHQETVAAT